MAAVTLPSNPTNGQTFEVGSTTYTYNSTLGVWDSESPASGGSGTTVYATFAELPLSGIDPGAQAFISENNRLYLWNGSGWYNIALINTAPTITSGPNASYELASDGTPVVLTLIAEDPEGFPLTWSYSVTSGTLGSTVVSQADNVFTVTPSTNTADAGVFNITFTASDGINLATAASTFTLAFGVADAYYNLNSTLIKTGTTAGLTNATIIEESTNAFTVTKTGDVYQGSFSPYSPAGWSNYFDGVNDYIQVNNSVGFSADFTFEFWMNAPAITNGHIMTKQPGTGSNIDAFVVNGTTGQVGIILRAGAVEIYTTNNMCDGQWHHIAFSRTSGSLKVFVDGILDGQITNTEATVYLDGTEPWTIGRHGRYNGYYYKGYLADVRLVVGTGLYSANFDVPTESLTAVAGTTILACQGNNIRDVSGTYTVTPSGVLVVPNSPYLPSEQYDPAVHGGSMYFDGTGDYLTFTEPAPTSGDLTVECWIYPVSPQVDVQPFIWGNEGNAAGAFALQYVSDGRQLGVWLDAYGSQKFLTPLDSINSDAWSHIAVVKNSGAIYVYVNGVFVGQYPNSLTAYPHTTTLGRGTTINIGNYTGGGAPGPYDFKGYISDFRYVSGTAVYTSNFTPPTQSLTAISGTQVLIRGANAGVYDEMGKTNIALYGNAATSTTRTKYNSTSTYFDGSGDYATIEVPAIGTGDFTIEGWVNWVGVTAGNYVFDFRDGVSTVRPALTLNPDWRYVSESAYVITSNVTPSTNVWYHFAIVRYNGTATLYINGSSLGSAADSRNYVGTNAGKIASYYGLTGNTSMFLEDFRITVGRARYTANFTPPTAALGFSNAE